MLVYIFWRFCAYVGHKNELRGYLYENEAMLCLDVGNGVTSDDIESARDGLCSHGAAVWGVCVHGAQ